MKCPICGEVFNKSVSVKLHMKVHEQEKNKMNCPMCHVGEEYQIKDPDSDSKNYCKGCGSKYFNKERVR